jgi:hypothetical protein
MPAPATSTKPEFLQVAQPFSLQKIHPISISKPGSTKGK